MPAITIYSWNINGIRSANKKGFSEWLKNTQPDILCLQEIRINSEKLNSVDVYTQDYKTYWNHAERLGYSGTALFTKTKPLSINTGIAGINTDPEGRTQIIEFGKFCLINCYFPNGNISDLRLTYKLNFYSNFLQRLTTINKPVIICADLNTAHTEIDLANPKGAKGKSGFLSIEREWVDKLLDRGYIDVLRYYNPNKKDLYTWWSIRQGKKYLLSGWRFDYIFIDKNLLTNIEDVFYEPDNNISDHVPIGVKLYL